jgi:hypothetical protein
MIRRADEYLGEQKTGFLCGQIRSPEARWGRVR